MKKTQHFSRVNEDGEWRLDLFPVEENAFAKWGFQQYKSTPLGWVEMGDSQQYYSKKLAMKSIYKLGYQKVA